MGPFKHISYIPVHGRMNWTYGINMTTQHNFRIAILAWPSEDIESLGIFGNVLFLDIVALRFQACGQPVTDFFLIARDGLNLSEILMETDEV